jgi:hypothetical protein
VVVLIRAFNRRGGKTDTWGVAQANMMPRRGRSATDESGGFLKNLSAESAQGSLLPSAGRDRSRETRARAG